MTLEYVKLFTCSRLRKGDLVYNTFSYHLGPAGIMIGNSAINLGCSVLPGGVGNTDLQIETIRAVKPTFMLELLLF